MEGSSRQSGDEGKETVGAGKNGKRRSQEFQATRVNCFLRDSHSAPERMRGATSMRRGVSWKTLAAFQGRPSRVRYSRMLRASAMLLKEMSCTIISARNLSVCISSGSSSRWWQSEEMRRPKGISSEVPETSCGSGPAVDSTSRSHSRATRLQPASCIFERYMEVGRMVTFSRMRSIFFTEASLAEKCMTLKTEFPTEVWAIFMPDARGTEPTESKRLPSRCRDPDGSW